MFNLHDVRIVVAGGSLGIGLATAQLLTDCGASIVIAGRNIAKMESANRLLGPHASSSAFDSRRSLSPRRRGRQ